MSPDTPVDAGSIPQRQFSSARRGLDPGEVRAYLHQISELVSSLQSREAEAHQRAERAEDRAVRAEQPDQHRLVEMLGDETARVLDAARDAAADIREKAEASAARLIREANEQARELRAEGEADVLAQRSQMLADVEELRQDAEAELERRRAEGDQLVAEMRREGQSAADGLRQEAEKERAAATVEADDIREAARGEARRLVAEARTMRERVLGDLSRRRRIAREQLERLNAARDRLLAAYEVVRRTVDEATAELTIALPEAKVASDSAQRRVRSEPDLTMDDMESQVSMARMAGLLPPLVESGSSELDALLDGDRPAEPSGLPGAIAAPAPETDPLAGSEPGLHPGAPGHAGRPGDPGDTAATGVAPPAEVTEATAPSEETLPRVETRESPGPDAGAEAADSDAGDPADGSDVGDPGPGGGSAGSEQEGTGWEDVDGDGAFDLDGDLAGDPDVGLDDGLDLLDDAYDAGTDQAPAPGPGGGTEHEPAWSDTLGDLLAGAGGGDVPRRPESEADAGGEVPAGQEGGPEPGPMAERVFTTSVDDVFARLKNGGTGHTPDHVLLRQRDETLEPLDRALARRLKRVLADEQNEVMDLVRRGASGLEELLPRVEEHAARYGGVVADEVHTAAYWGAAAVEGEPAGSCDHLTVELGQAVTGPLRERIARSASEADGDADELTERLRALYREWKNEHLGEAVRHITAAAYALGVYEAIPDGTMLRWVVDGSTTACPDAEQNARAGAVTKGHAFPTGHCAPPSHAGCRCSIVPVAAGGAAVAPRDPGHESVADPLPHRQAM